MDPTRPTDPAPAAPEAPRPTGQQPAVEARIRRLPTGSSMTRRPTTTVVSARRPDPTWSSRLAEFLDSFASPRAPTPIAARIAAVRQLANLLQAGLPLGQALLELAAASRGRLAASLRAVADRLDRGSTFTNAIATVPGFFGPREAALVAIGERTGHLPEVLGRIVEGWTRAQEDRRALASAVAYPILLILLSVLLHPLPDAFRCGARCYASAVSTGALVLGGSAAVLALAVWIGRRARVGWILREAAWVLPVVRSVYRPRVHADVLQALSSGLAAGLGLPETLELAGKASADRAGSRACAEIARRLAFGETFVDAVGATGLVAEGALVSLAGGERSGTLPDSLARLSAELARTHRSRLTWSMRVLTTVCFLAVAAWVGSRIVDTLSGDVLGAEDEALNQIQREIPGLFVPLRGR